MRDKEELLKISDHIYYEFSMFVSLVLEMTKGYPPGTINNAMLQSFALHVRNLIDFLYNDSHNSDDVYAGDFFKDPTRWLSVRKAITPELSKAKKRVNKEVAHLTYSRLKVLPADKKWAFVNLSNEMIAVFDPFITNVNRGLLDPRWSNFFKF